MTTVPRLCLGSRVLIDGEPQTVMGLSGTTVMLVYETRPPTAMLLTHLLASPDSSSSTPLPRDGWELTPW